VHIVEGKGVQLGERATVEDVAAHWAQISDMSGAVPLGSGGEVTRKIFS
jgi:hypothetical protein